MLAIPVVVELAALSYTTRQAKASEAATEQQRKTEIEIANDNQREAALQTYIDKMSELLLMRKLRQSADEDEVRVIARVRTMMILPRLEETCKNSVLLFLQESSLIEKDKSIIDLGGATLRGANLWNDNLSAANLRKTNLRDANLTEANLSFAHLCTANLSGADLSSARLCGADLSDARGVTDEQLNEAKSLQGATMPDGSKHP